MKIAELNKGKVWRVYQSDVEQLPVIPGPGGAVDITDVDPEPNIGDVYNSDSGTFSSPEPELPRFQVSGISQTQWRELFTMTEQVRSDWVENNIEGDLSGLSGEDLDSSASALGLPDGVTYRDILRTGYKSFAAVDWVDVSSQKVQLMIKVMSAVGILDAPERAAVILKGCLWMSN